MPIEELTLATDGYFWTVKDGKYDKKYSLFIDDTGKVTAKEQIIDKRTHTFESQFPRRLEINTTKDYKKDKKIMKFIRWIKRHLKGTRIDVISHKELGMFN